MNKKHLLSIVTLIIISAVSYVHSGFNLGMAGAVKSRVDKLDKKIREKTGTGVSVERASASSSSSLSKSPGIRTAAASITVSPEKSYAALSKIWLPNETAYSSMRQSETKNTTEFTSISDPDIYKNNCFVILDNSETDPVIFDLDSRSMAVSTEEFPPSGIKYPGAFVRAVYYETRSDDTDIRWYAGSYGTYQRGDVLIKNVNSSTWQFAYHEFGTGIKLYNSRQALTVYGGAIPAGAILSLLGSDTIDESLNTSGILLEKFHFIHCNKEISDFNSPEAEGKYIEIEDGMLPKGISIKLKYNGGLIASDMNGDGKFSSADIGIASAELIELKPVTGAMEIDYEWEEFE